MGSYIQLTSADGQQLRAYRAAPQGPARGGIVVLQEIFGINAYIRSVCDQLADAGYLAIAPALFDRKEPGFESGYSAEEIAVARKFLMEMDWEKGLLDTDAAVQELKGNGPVAVFGFCIGASLAFLASARLDGISAAVCYHGGQIIRFVDEKPATPVQMHFGSADPTIPLSDVETIKGKQPEVEVHVYDGANHGFGCDDPVRATYHPVSAALAWKRSLAFLEKALAR